MGVVLEERGLHILQMWFSKIGFMFPSHSKGPWTARLWPPWTTAKYSRSDSGNSGSGGRPLDMLSLLLTIYHTGGQSKEHTYTSSTSLPETCFAAGSLLGAEVTVTCSAHLEPFLLFLVLVVVLLCSSGIGRKASLLLRWGLLSHFLPRVVQEGKYGHLMTQGHTGPYPLKMGCKWGRLPRDEPLPQPPSSGVQTENLIRNLIQ